MTKFEISFNNDNDDFDRDSDNIMGVSVYNSDGEIIPSKNIRVELSFSKNAMIGFGTELIRHALRERCDGMHWHLDPTHRGDANNAVQKMGVFMHPDSPEVIIMRGEIGDLDQVLGCQKKSD